MQKKIGIIGTGAVAKKLAQGFINLGHQVMIGSRDTAKMAAIKETLALPTGSFEEAARFGEIIVLAVKGHAAKNALTLAGSQNLSGKMIIDTTNPIDDKPPVNGVLQYFTSPNQSLMELLQTEFPESKFVKSFNCVGSAFMVNPDFDGQQPTMFIAGNDADAKKELTLILHQFGWDVEDCGKAEAARAIEPLAMLWCIPGFLENRWTHAFKLLRK